MHLFYDFTPFLDCDQALGMESRAILDSQITASSQWDEDHAPYLGRLNNHKSGSSIGAWVVELNPDGMLRFAARFHEFLYFFMY